MVMVDIVDVWNSENGGGLVCWTFKITKLRGKKLPS
jgi:hypothetical protein